MIFDNENLNLKVHEWISKYTHTGSQKAVEAQKTTEDPSEEYKPENFDLITWFVVNKN
jgi:hypothetical protein